MKKIIMLTEYAANTLDDVFFEGEILCMNELEQYARVGAGLGAPTLVDEYLVNDDGSLKYIVLFEKAGK